VAAIRPATRNSFCKGRISSCFKAYFGWEALDILNIGDIIAGRPGQALGLLFVFVKQRRGRPVALQRVDGIVPTTPAAETQPPPDTTSTPAAQPPTNNRQGRRDRNNRDPVDSIHRRLTEIRQEIPGAVRSIVRQELDARQPGATQIPASTNTGAVSAASNPSPEAPAKGKEAKSGNAGWIVILAAAVASAIAAAIILGD